MTDSSAQTSTRERPARRAGSLRSVFAAAPVIAGALLFLAATPALADGGPHITGTNSGTFALTSDSCGGCHRAHTAQGAMLLNASTEDALCFNCHGATGAGATTNVQQGLQYVPSGTGTRTGTILGALRNGGFDQAVIDSANPARYWVDGGFANNQGKIRVKQDLLPADVTSAHLNLPENGLAAPTVAWGNGAIGTAGAGPVVSIGCTTCHNPHGNGQYRILTPRPGPTVVSGTFTGPAADANVIDSPVDPDNNRSFPTKNYTIIAVKGTVPNLSTFMLYARDVLDAFSATPVKPWPPGTYNNTAGDYWHSRVPWNKNDANSMLDAPNGVPSGINGFNNQISAWCTTCHTRYYSTDTSPNDNPFDPIYYRRHNTTGHLACTTCHVSHGTNALMGNPADTVPFPDGTVIKGDSRLLKVNGRGTCQLCHDPTYTAVVPSYSGPTPMPGVP